MRSPAHPRGKVLIVEDEPDVREAVATILESHGFGAAQAPDGLDALIALRTDEERPDLILLDLMMPGMNGWQFRAAQRADPALAGIPVVVMSAVGDRSLDVAATLDKPFDVEKLLATVERVAEARAPAPRG